MHLIPNSFYFLKLKFYLVGYKYSNLCFSKIEIRLYCCFPSFYSEYFYHENSSVFAISNRKLDFYLLINQPFLCHKEQFNLGYLERLLMWNFVVILIREFRYFALVYILFCLFIDHLAFLAELICVQQTLSAVWKYVFTFFTKYIEYIIVIFPYSIAFLLSYCFIWSLSLLWFLSFWL